MRILTLTEENIPETVSEAATVLRTGGVILYPTDTLYGLGADAFSNAAVDRVYAIKSRDEKKPIHCIVADMEMAEQYVEVSNDARLLAKEFFPGPLTLILRKKSNVEGGVARGIKTFGIRIPQNDFCIALVCAFDRPFTATSANAAGEQAPRSVDDILAQLGASVPMIDLIVDAGTLPASQPSTVIDMSGEEPAVVREGAIPAADIWNAIRAEP